MKHLGLVPLILLIGILPFYGLATAELTAYQQVPSQANVGEPVVVTVMLSYKGMNSTQAAITPSLPLGVITDTGVQTAELYPGTLQPISYSIIPEQSGTYWIVSQISYEEDGSWHNLMLEAPFSAIGESAQGLQPMSGKQAPGDRFSGEADRGMNPRGGIPRGGLPGERGTSPNGEWLSNENDGDSMPPDTQPQGQEDMQAPDHEM